MDSEEDFIEPSAGVGPHQELPRNSSASSLVETHHPALASSTSSLPYPPSDVEPPSTIHTGDIVSREILPVSSPSSTEHVDIRNPPEDGAESLMSSYERHGSSTTISPLPSPLPIKESLGLTGSFIIIGGSLGVLGALGFLIFLWFGYGPTPEAADATRFWRYITLHDYATQAITLSSLFLRFIISSQAAVCTSMIAAVVLEKRRARRSQVAWFSVIRSINDGPSKLAGMMVTSTSFVRHFEFWLLLLMVAVTLGLQFSSTILLTDIHDFVMIGNLNNTEALSLLVYQRDDFHLQLTGDTFLSEPPLYATFGEAQDEFDATPNINGVSNTGIIQRALLPLPESNDRTSIRRFDGNLIVMNSQVACMRPHIDAQYSSVHFSIDADDTLGMLEGRLQYNSTFRNAHVSSDSLCNEDMCEEVAFGCPVPGATLGWQSNTCLFDGLGAQNWNTSFDPKWNPSDGPWSRNSSVTLVFTTNMESEDWNMVSDQGVPLPPGSPYQEWQSYELIPGRFLNITLCFAAFYLDRHQVSMSSSTGHPPREPVTNMSLTSRTYSTADVQDMMGVSVPQKSHGARAILDMQIVGPPDDGPSSSPANSMTSFSYAGGNMTLAKLTPTVLETVMYYELTAGFQNNGSISFCYFCTADGYAVNPALGLLFNDIVVQTGRAANAMLTMMSTIWSDIYYTYVPTMRTLQGAQMTATTSVRAPGPCSTHGCPGMVAVTTLVCIHLVYVTIITILYVRQVRYSRRGNIWHSISQLVSGELKETLGNTNNAGDDVVDKHVAKANDDPFVKIGWLEEVGRVEIMRYPAEASTVYGSMKSSFSRVWGKIRRNERNKRQ
ncbi:hypothetical protein F5Y06DRAFT_297511 [Hypoxylon sp. FL0890]|nr:hypothetical protein F5Y06DRAFT_297511 [Hypoxylon sp. FL0890]